MGVGGSGWRSSGVGGPGWKGPPTREHRGGFVRCRRMVEIPGGGGAMKLFCTASPRGAPLCLSRGGYHAPPPIPSPHTLFLSPGLGRQEGKFDEAVGEERDTLLGDAGNLQPVFQNVQFHRLPRAPPQRIIRGGPSCGDGGDGDEQRPPPPARPKPWGNRPREGGPVLGAGLICTRSRKKEAWQVAKKKEAWGGPAGYSELRGGQANSARRSAAPGAAAAGVRCNKQLATQTPGP